MALRLPDLAMQRVPIPDDEELHFAACLKVASGEDEHWPSQRSRCSSWGESEPSVSRTRRSGDLGSRRPNGLGGRASLEDILGGSPRRSGRSGSRHGRGPVRPTQRQPIDDSTSVPAEVHQAMMQLGSEVRSRATHRKAFKPETGEQYLEHVDATRLRAESAAQLAPPPPELVPPTEVPPALGLILPIAGRPHSTCASEAHKAMEGVSGRWGTPDSVPVPLQVI